MSIQQDNEGYTPGKSPLTFNQYALIIFVTTPVTAWLLAYYGFIPFDPVYSAIAAFAFSIVYVGYRWYYSTQYRKEKVVESLEEKES